MGCLAALNHFNQEEKKRILMAYFGEITKENLGHLNAMCALMCLRDALWALLQIKNGTSTINYKTYFDRYFNQFWEEIDAAR